MRKNSLKIEVEKLRKEFYEGMRELKKSQRKTDEQLKETDEELTKLFKKTDTQTRQITDGFDKFTEGLVEPNVAPLFREFGIKVRGTGTRVKRYYNGETMEVDILATGKMNKKENVVIFIEAKTDPDTARYKG